MSNYPLYLARMEFFSYLIREQFSIDTARILSNAPDIDYLDRKSVVDTFKSLTSICDMPHDAAAVLAGSDGLFRDTFHGLIEVSKRFIHLKDKYPNKPHSNLALEVVF